jgi:8-oxo-dGTP diphosphatase
MDDIIKSLAENALKEGIQRFVVGAVIMKDSKFLLLQRPKDDFMGGIFELPSGKVEENEKLDIALKREVKEETGLEIEKILRYLGHFDYLSGSGKKTRQFNFLILVKEANIVLTEHDSFAWAEKAELEKYPLTESVRKILGAI